MGISTNCFRNLKWVFLLGCLVLGVFAGPYRCSPDRSFQKTPGLRAVWVQADSITTPENADEMLARIEAGRFNAVFVNVFVYGYAYYESVLLEKHPDLAPSYDPLAYLIEQAHQRNIKVHTWLVAGPVGSGKWGPSPILSQHPDWAMVSLDGEKRSWLNYNRPDVRQFIGDIAVELVKNYKVDGIHLDYTRYPDPGWKWGFDSYSADAFAKEYGLDLEALRYSELPAYGSFVGNPLVGIDTAQMLAVFDNGRPAVLLNRYGAGEVVLFNWEADERRVAASSEILRRSINHLLGDEGGVYILRSGTNLEEYNLEDFNRTFTWLEDIGRPPIEVTEADLVTLDVDAVLVMPSVYLISSQEAFDLADFVYRGGGVIFIDGPIRSIEDKNIQALTGMRTQGKHFQETGLLIATSEHDIIPHSNRKLERNSELKDYLTRDAQWKTFRKQGINKLLHDVYQRVKREAPHVLVTITVAVSHETLDERHFLDWQTWLEGGYVDLIIPRAFATQDEPWAPLIADWQPVLKNSDRVMLGLKAFTRQNSNQRIPKTPARMLSEIDLAQASGSNGVILFDIEHIGDDVLEALATGPFSSTDIPSD
jgi:uncharacterized lipoprotein YddW (UPF0748 family)